MNTSTTPDTRLQRAEAEQDAERRAANIVRHQHSEDLIKAHLLVMYEKGVFDAFDQIKRGEVGK